jgi:hypothetical protein
MSKKYISALELVRACFGNVEDCHSLNPHHSPEQLHRFKINILTIFYPFEGSPEFMGMLHSACPQPSLAQLH